MQFFTRRQRKGISLERQGDLAPSKLPDPGVEAHGFSVYEAEDFVALG